MTTNIRRRQLLTSLAGFALLPACSRLPEPVEREAGYWESLSEGALYDLAVAEGEVHLYTNTARRAVERIRSEFVAQYPGIEVLAYSMTGAHTLNRFLSEAAAGRSVADLVISSAMDSQALLVSQGHAATYRSPEAANFPDVGDWSSVLHPLTFEPVVFIANTRALGSRSVPASHAEFFVAATTARDRWHQQIATLDAEKGSTGFMFFSQSPYSEPSLEDIVTALGQTETRRYATTSSLMERLLSGEHAIGYNCHGSYTRRVVERSDTLEMVYPSDFTTVMMRLALVNSRAHHPAASRLLLRFFQSVLGQTALRDHDFFPLRHGLKGQYTASALRAQLGDRLRPIPVDESLLYWMDMERRLRFMRHWRRAFYG